MARPKKLINEITVNDVTYKIYRLTEKGKSNGKDYEYLRVNVPTGELYENGAIKYKFIRAKDMPELYDKIVTFLDSLKQTDPSDVLLKDDIKAWMVDYKLNKIEKTSYDRIEQTVEKRIIPIIGKIKISKLTENDIQKCINDAINGGLSYSSVKKIKVVIGAYLKKRKNIVDIDMDEVEMPQKKTIDTQNNKHEKILILKPKEIDAIKDVIYNGYISSFILNSKVLTDEEKEKLRIFIKDAPVFDFMLQTGLRASEVCGLRYEHWNEETKTLRITENRTKAQRRDKDGNKLGKAPASSSPKTNSSEAIIKISNKANDILAEMKKADKFKKYVVHNDKGEPITYDTLSKRWHNILHAAGIETNKTKSGKYKHEYGLHCLRHTFASMLYQKYHDPKLVQTKLRHSDIQTTMNIYVDLFSEYEASIEEDFEV